MTTTQAKNTTLHELSQQASAHAATRPRPHNKNETWRNVKLSALVKEYGSARTDNDTVIDTVTAPTDLPYEKCIVIDHGIIDDPSCPVIPTATTWHHQLAENQDLSGQWLLTAAGADQHYVMDITSDQNFCIYNHARPGSGHSASSISIRIAANVRCDIVLIHDIASDARSSIAIEIDAAADSVCRIDECECSLQQGQILRHSKISLANNAQLAWRQCQVSSELNRSCADVDLNGEHAHIDLAAATIANGDQQAHQYIRVNHRTANTSSTQCFKCIATDSARFSFDGLIDIASGADGSNAEQINANLQLSDTCRVHSRPQLDIDTDDVIATHGSASGQIDEDEIHYLRCRGISDSKARRLITRGFLQEVIHSFHSEYAQKISTDLLNDVLS